MKISQRLQIIKDLSSLTQEKLARQIGVSFATLNSWINERSLPHKRHQDKINFIYQWIIETSIFLLKRFYIIDAINNFFFKIIF